MTTKLISLPEGLVSMFEEFAEEAGHKYECVGVGCGSCEFEVNAKGLEALLKKFADHVSTIIVGSAVEPPEEDE